MTVEDAVRIALERNPSIQSANALWQSRKPLEETALAPSDPVIEFLYGEGNNGQGSPYGSGTGWSIFQSMLFPGKSLIDRSILKDQSRIVGKSYQNTRRLLENQTEQACYALLLAQKRLGENARFISWLKQVRSIARIQAAAGKSPILDYLTAKNAVKQARLRRISIRIQVMAARRSLNTLLNLPVDTPTTIRTPEIPKGPPPDLSALGDLQDFLSRHRPDIQQMETSLSLSSRKLSRARMDYLPDFQIQGSEGEFGCYAFSNTNCYAVGIGFNIPLFAGIKQQRKIAALEQTISSQQWLTIWKKTLAITKALNARTKALMAYRAFLINDREIFPDADLAFRLSLSEYETQRITFLYLNTSVSNLHLARYNRFKSLIAYYQALSDLKAQTGSGIWFAKETGK